MREPRKYRWSWPSIRWGMEGTVFGTVTDSVSVSGYSCSYGDGYSDERGLGYGDSTGHGCRYGYGNSNSPQVDGLEGVFVIIWLGGEVEWGGYEQIYDNVSAM